MLWQEAAARDRLRLLGPPFRGLEVAGTDRPGGDSGHLSACAGCESRAEGDPAARTTDDAPGSGKTCDNPGWSSLWVFEDGCSSTRGLGASTPGPHLLLANGRTRWRPYALGAVDAGGATCDHCRVGATRRGSTFGRAGCSPLGQGPLGPEKPSPSPREKPASAVGGMFRKGCLYVIVYSDPPAPNYAR